MWKFGSPMGYLYIANQKFCDVTVLTKKRGFCAISHEKRNISKFHSYV